MSYSQKAIDHANNPRNVGTIKNADGVGKHGEPGQGNHMVIYLAIESHIIKDAKFQTYGCPGAMACGSMVTELAKGKSIQDAKSITPEILMAALDGLPLGKRHCAGLAAAALAKAIDAAEAHNKPTPKAKP